MSQSRRRFLETAAVSTGAAFAVSNVLAEDTKKKSPNETIRVGLIGCGGRGRHNARVMAKLPNCEVVAVCDVHAGRMGEARKEHGGEKVAAEKDFRKVLDRKDVDAVIVAPTANWHVLPTIAACQAGKDVYVEKPLGRSIGEGRAAVEAAEKYDRIVQIGTQQRSWEHYRKAVEVIHSGLLGEICEVKVWDYDQHYPGLGAPEDTTPPPELDWDFYCGPAPLIPYNPAYFGYGHYFHPHFGGSWHVDWGVHHYDIVNWAMGVTAPKSAMAMGGRFAFPKEADNRIWPDTFNAILEYGPSPVAKLGFQMHYNYRCGCRSIHRSHCKQFLGTHGTLTLDRSGFDVKTEQHNKGGKLEAAIEEVSGKGPYHNHQEVFLQNVRNRTKPFADVEQGHYASNAGHLMSIAYWTGRKVEWDGAKEEIVGDAEANELVTRKYRKPWTLEV